MPMLPSVTVHESAESAINAIKEKRSALYVIQLTPTTELQRRLEHLFGDWCDYVPGLKTVYVYRRASVQFRGATLSPDDERLVFIERESLVKINLNQRGECWIGSH